MGAGPGLDHPFVRSAFGAHITVEHTAFWTLSNLYAVQGLACYWRDLEELEVLLEDQGLGPGLGLENAQGPGQGQGPGPGHDEEPQTSDQGPGLEDQGLDLGLGLGLGPGPDHDEGTRASGSPSSTHTHRFAHTKPSPVQGMMKAFLEHCSQQQFAQTRAQAEALTQVQAQVQQAQPQIGAQPQSPTQSHIPVQTPGPDSLLASPSPGCRAVDVKGAREMPSIDAYTFSLLRFASKHR